MSEALGVVVSAQKILYSTIVCTIVLEYFTTLYYTLEDQTFSFVVSSVEKRYYCIRKLNG